MISEHASLVHIVEFLLRVVRPTFEPEMDWLAGDRPAFAAVFDWKSVELDSEWVAASMCV